MAISGEALSWRNDLRYGGARVVFPRVTSFNTRFRNLNS